MTYALRHHRWMNLAWALSEATIAGRVAWTVADGEFDDCNAFRVSTSAGSVLVSRRAHGPGSVYAWLEDANGRTVDQTSAEMCSNLNFLYGLLRYPEGSADQQEESARIIQAILANLGM